MDEGEEEENNGNNNDYLKKNDDKNIKRIMKLILLCVGAWKDAAMDICIDALMNGWVGLNWKKTLQNIQQLC